MLKRGVNDYAKVNPHNFRPVFSQEQLSASLCATSLRVSAAFRSATIMDVEQLHNDIRAAYVSDPITANQFPQPSDPKWTSSDGLLHQNN